MLQVNLLPWRKQYQIKRICQIIILLLFYLGLAIIVIATLVIKTASQNDFLQQQIQRQKQLHTELLLNINQNKQHQSQLDQLSEQLKQVKQLKQQNEKIMQLFILISQQLPTNAWLEKVSINKHKLHIIGNTINYSSIAHFANSLKTYSALDQVMLINVMYKKNIIALFNAYLTFTLEAVWR